MRKRDKIFRSVPELISKLQKDIKGIDGPIWYRGQADVSWWLQPSLVRGASHINEMTLIRRFKQNAMMLVSPRPSNSIEWLFIMRHHSVPTRLLDWTEGLLIAAYFAVYEEPTAAGALWALLPKELNELANIEDIPSFEENEEIASYSPDNFLGETSSMLLPIAIIAPRNNTRMQAQLSVFTINHRDNTPIEELGRKNHVWRYIVPCEYKEEVKRELDMIGVGKFQLFPELQSIGEILRGEC